MKLYATAVGLSVVMFGLSFGLTVSAASIDWQTELASAATVLDFSDSIQGILSSYGKFAAIVNSAAPPARMAAADSAAGSYIAPDWRAMASDLKQFAVRPTGMMDLSTNLAAVEQPQKLQPVAEIKIKLPKKLSPRDPVEPAFMKIPYSYQSLDLKQLASSALSSLEPLQRKKYEAPLRESSPPPPRSLNWPRHQLQPSPPNLPYSFSEPRWTVGPVSFPSETIQSLALSKMPRPLFAVTRTEDQTGKVAGFTLQQLKQFFTRPAPPANTPSAPPASNMTGAALNKQNTTEQDLIRIIGGSKELQKILRGPQGLPGAAGPRGLQGLPGIAGLQGVPGPAGGASTTAIIVSHSIDNAMFNNIAYDWPGSQGAASTVLSNDGAGNLSWVAAGSGSQTPWTANIDADNFSLLDFGANLTARAGLAIASGGAGDLALDSASGLLTSNATALTLGGSATINGGSASSGTLTLVSTTHGTKGDIQFFSSANKITSGGALTVAGALSASNFSGTSSGTNTGDQNLFSQIVVSGQTTVTTASATQALTLVAGSNVTITTDNTAKSITIAASGGGGSQTPWTSDIDADNFSLLDFGANLTSRSATTIGSANNASGASGLLTLNSGTGTTATGGLTFVTGNASAGTAGNVSINVGTSTSGNGSILIGTAARTQTITIGNSTGGVITIGASSGSGLILNDAHWSVSDAGAAAFVSVTEGGTALSSKYAPIAGNFVTVTANGTLTGETGIDALSTAISTSSTLNVDGATTLAALTIDAGSNFTMSSGTGLFAQTHAVTTDATADSHTLTLSAGGSGSTGVLRGLVISQSDTGTTGVFDSLAYIGNLKTPETTTNGLFIEHNAASGTLTNAIQIAETAGTITDGILITGTLGNILNSGSIDITGAGAITGATGVSSTTGTFSSAIAANGGITFDASTDTIGSFTAGGTILMGNNVIENIGAAGTDFLAGGGLTLDDILTVNDDVDLVFAAGENLNIDGATIDNTTTAGVIDLNVDTVTTNNIALNLDYIIRDSAGITGTGARINATIDTDASESSTGYGLYINAANNDASSTLTGLYVDVGTGAGTEYAASFMNGNVGIGTSVPGHSLELFTAAGTEISFAMRDGDVAHGLTGFGDQTDAYGKFDTFSATAGGLQIAGLSDSAVDVGLNLLGVIGDADPTDSVAAVTITGTKKNGTVVQALGSSETIFAIDNAFGSDLFVVFGDGNVSTKRVSSTNTYTTAPSGEQAQIAANVASKGIGTVTDRRSGFVAAMTDEGVSNVAISGATNASPIVITSAANTFATGDQVAISGVGGNTAANGLWVVTVTNSTTFSLNGSTGNGAYTSGGIATNRSMMYGFSCSLGLDYARDSLSGSGGLGNIANADDANCFVAYNNSSVKATDAIYIGSAAVSGSDWSTGFTMGADADTGIQLNGAYNYGIDLANGTPSYTSGAIRLVNNSSIVGRNAADSADINIISLNASDNVSLRAGGLTIDSSSNVDIGGTITAGSSNTAVTLSTGKIDADALTITSSGTTGSTSSNSGLEVISDGLTLLRGCTDGQLLEWTDAGGWACADDNTSAGAGISTVQEGDSTIDGSANTLDFLAADFTITSSPAGEANIAIDYANSEITRNNQSETIVNDWTFSFAETEDLAIDISISGTNSGQGGLITLTNSSASGSQYGLYLDNAASSGSTEALIALDNSDADTAVAAAIRIIDAGGGFTNIIDNAGTLISGAELNRLDGIDAALVDENNLTSGDGAGGTSSGSGLEAGTGGIGLLQGCADTEVLKWDETNSIWECASSQYSKFISVASTNVLNSTGITNDVAMTDVDVTTQTSANATQVLLQVNLDYSTQLASTDYHMHVAPNGDAQALDNLVCTLGDDDLTSGVLGCGNIIIVKLDAGQIFDYSIDELTATAAVVVARINVIGYWEPVTTGADVAENYYAADTTIEAGDVVSIDSTAPNGVMKSSKAYDSQALGVISTNPGIVLDDYLDPNKDVVILPQSLKNRLPVAVALTGRVPVKVSTENGSVAPGDYLTSSSIPGVAMKASKAGKIIGQAMTGYENSDELGSVMMFVSKGYSGGLNLASLIAGTQIDQAGDNPPSENIVSLDFGKVLLKHLGNKPEQAEIVNISEILTDRLAAGIEVIAPRGLFEGLEVETIGALNDLVTFNSDTFFFGRPYFNSDTGGFAVIKQGQQEVEITFDKEYLGQPVVAATIAFESNQDSNAAAVLNNQLSFVVAGKTTNGFIIRLSRGAPVDVPFSWIALAIKNPKIFGGQATAPAAGQVSGENTTEPAPEPSVPDEATLPAEDESPEPAVEIIEPSAETVPPEPEPAAESASLPE